MDYFYGIIWLAIGLILIFALSKEHKIFILAGAYFLLLGAWWIGNALLPETNLFEGGWGIAFRAVSAAALLFLIGFYYFKFWRPNHRKKSERPGEENSKEKQ